MFVLHSYMVYDKDGDLNVPILGGHGTSCEAVQRSSGSWDQYMSWTAGRQDPHDMPFTRITGGHYFIPSVEQGWGW